MVQFRRIWLVAAALGALAAGCGGRAGTDLSADDSATDGCAVDDDCVPAGDSCCDCPTFALPAASGWKQSCEDVTCPQPADCAPVQAVCEGGTCALRCDPVPCDQVCDSGFRTDAAGCLTCDCQPQQGAPGCAIDDDCVEVPADCCGCARGGADTAVPVDQVSTYLDSLACDPDPACPGVDVCDSSLQVVCVNGSCALVSAGVTGPMEADAGPQSPAPDQRCGTPDLPPCPAGEVCVLNDPSADDASQAGVGVCRPA